MSASLYLTIIIIVAVVCEVAWDALPLIRVMLILASLLQAEATVALAGN